MRELTESLSFEIFAGHLSDLKKSQNNELHGGQQEKPGKSTSHQLYDGQPHLMSSIPPKGPLTSFDTNSNVKSSNTEEKDKKSVGHARQTTFSCQDKSGYYADVEAGCEVSEINVVYFSRCISIRLMNFIYKRLLIALRLLMFENLHL